MNIGIDPKTVTSCMISARRTATGNAQLWQAVKGGWGMVISPIHELAVLNALRVLVAHRDLGRYSQGDVCCERENGGNTFLTVGSGEPIEIQRADVEDVIRVLEKLREQDRVDPNASDAWVNAMMNPGAVAIPDLMRPDPKRTVQINYGVFSATIGHDRAWVSRVASDNPTTWKAEVRFDELDELEGIIRLIRAARDVSK